MLGLGKRLRYVVDQQCRWVARGACLSGRIPRVRYAYLVRLDYAGRDTSLDIV